MAQGMVAEIAGDKGGIKGWRHLALCLYRVSAKHGDNGRVFVSRSKFSQARHERPKSISLLVSGTANARVTRQGPFRAKDEADQALEDAKGTVKPSGYAR